MYQRNRPRRCSCRGRCNKLAATNFVQSMRGIQILSHAIKLVKLNAFLKVHDANDFKNSVQAIKKFAESLDKKDLKYANIGIVLST